MSYTIYSQPGCGPCISLAAMLKRRGIAHTIVNIREDPGAAERVAALGGTGTPFTVNEDTGECWSGFLPDRYTAPVPSQSPSPAAVEFSLGVTEDGTPVHWGPVTDGSLLVITREDTTALCRRLIEDAAAAQWQVRVLVSPGTAVASTAQHPSVQVAADTIAQHALLQEVRELIDSRHAQAQAAPLGGSRPGFTPTLVLVDRLEALFHRWSQGPGGYRRTADALLTLETLAEYGNTLGVHLCVSMSERSSAFMAQDSRLTTLTSLTAGLSEEWGDGTAWGDASHAVLRTPAGDQQLVMLGASHPIPAHA